MSKKTQAAMEFLVTYGWAFLIIMITITALAYFGIFEPKKLLPNRCNFGPEFTCVDSAIELSSDSIKLRIRSNIPDTINVTSITLASDGATPISCTSNPLTSGSALIQSWRTAQALNLNWTTCNFAAAGFSQGNKGKLFIAINYNSAASGSSYSKATQGEIITTVT